MSASPSPAPATAPGAASPLDGPERVVPFGRPVIGPEEKAAVLEVIEQPILTHGERVKAFERAFAEFTGAPHALATNSATGALHLAWMFSGVGPGDEVIVTAQSHVATAHAVGLCGATCVFADVEPETGNVDLGAVERLITERTRGLALVHYLGRPVDMDRTMDLARRHDLFVVEDCAIAVGARWRGTHVGLHGDAGAFSFYPVKHLTTGEGGMLITRRDDVAEIAATQRAFGIDRTRPEERAVPGGYDVERLGNNYRLNEIGAALGLVQMTRLPGFLETRARNHAALAQGLRDVPGTFQLAAPRAGEDPAWYCFQLILEDALAARRTELVAGLKARGVGSSVYYPMAIPCLKHYRKALGTGPATAPVADRISRASIALPIGPHVDEDDLAHVVKSVRETADHLL